MGELWLRAEDYAGPVRWRWVLTDPGGQLVASHRVSLDLNAWQFGAFADIHAFLRLHTVPDRRVEDEARILAEVGNWVGEQVLGPVAGALARASPVTVRVVVPAEARRLAFRPLELAHAGARPLAAQGVTFVMQPASGSEVGILPQADSGRLRVLGLFSVPVGERPLNLRRERAGLARLFAELSADGRAVDLRVLQYGVTRTRLSEVLAEEEGWDVIHVSGHGAPGELLLETDAGEPDAVRASELADLLETARKRLKLVYASACWSAAAAGTEQRRLLGLDTEDQDPDGGSQDLMQDQPIETLATELTGRLGCAVLAMRYPVTDDFAIGLAHKVYSLLVREGRTLPQAVAIALEQVAAGPPTPACPALSVATPSLIGARAADLRLTAPVITAQSPPGPAGAVLDGFPAQPDRFVGRVAVMARANEALAPRSGISGVWLHGMPGCGKTACALELAYTHQHAFDQMLWFRAPDEDRGAASALIDFVLGLERAVGGLRLAHLLGDEQRFPGALQVLTQFMAHSRMLIVIDNAESLLSESGRWHDERWGLLVCALTAHTGLGRLVVTARRGLPVTDGQLTALAVDTLSLEEALLLAWELPNLTALARGAVQGLAAGQARGLARRVLKLAHGHPKLLELADAQAADPARLADALDSAEEAWRQTGVRPEGFFTPGGDIASPADYLLVLHAWTESVTARLPPGHRELFAFLCSLEEADRIRLVAMANWGNLWKRLELPSQPPDVNQGLTALARHGLCSAEADDQALSMARREVLHAYLQRMETFKQDVLTRSESAGAPSPLELAQMASLDTFILFNAGPDVEPDDATIYRMHPGISQAGRTQAGQVFQAAVDAELAAYWTRVALHARGNADPAISAELAAEDSGLVVGASLRAAPYLLRRKAWLEAARLLDGVLQRDHSKTLAITLLPALSQIAAATRDTDGELTAVGILARAQKAVNPAAAETTARRMLALALARDDYRAASVAAEELIDHYRRTGKLSEALQVVQDKRIYTERGSLGPWTRLRDEVKRLQVLADMGRAEQVFAETLRLQSQARALPDTTGPAETVPPWSTRELLLSTGCTAAIQLGMWDAALDLSDAKVLSQTSRYAPEAEAAQTKLNNCRPLLGIGRADWALEDLSSCREVFERTRDIRGLCMALSAIASVEDMQGHSDIAIGLQQDALRYGYLAADPSDLAACHRDLGDYYARSESTGQAVTHYMAAALIGAISGCGQQSTIEALAACLRKYSGTTPTPASAADLYTQVSQVPGAALGRLLGTLAPSSDAVQQALDSIINQARELAAAQASHLHELASWEPFIAAMLARDRFTSEMLDRELANYAQFAHRTRLGEVLAQIHHGQRDPNVIAGLDEVETAIATRALDALTGRVTISAALWPAMAIAPLLGDIVAAANGDDVAATRARRHLGEWAGKPDSAGRAMILGQIIDGDRDPALASRLKSSSDRAIVATVLHYVGPQQSAQGK